MRYILYCIRPRFLHKSMFLITLNFKFYLTRIWFIFKWSIDNFFKNLETALKGKGQKGFFPRTKIETTTATWIRQHHNVLSWIVSINKLFKAILFLIVSLVVFLGLPLPNYKATLYLIYSPKYGFYRSSPHMPKPSKTMFYHIFYNRCYLIFLSNAFILILSCLMCSLIQWNILNFATLSSFWLFTA